MQRPSYWMKRFVVKHVLESTREFIRRYVTEPIKPLPFLKTYHQHFILFTTPFKRYYDGVTIDVRRTVRVRSPERKPKYRPRFEKSKSACTPWNVCDVSAK